MSLDIKKVNKKIVIVFSGIGFLLSLVSGLISGSTFLKVISNSIISSIVIGGVIFISNLVIMVYLPELTGEGEVDEDEDSDSQVDIVMPQESYTVQSSGTVDNDIPGETSNDQGTVSSSVSGDQFKEIGMDNLASLDASTESFNQIQEDSSDDRDSPYTPTSSSDSGFGEHSTEDMAKAVKTVLKKD